MRDRRESGYKQRSMKRLPRRRTRRSATTTIREVAHRAGVSIATVSRVQRGTTPVSSEKRQRVLRAIDELAYRPSRLARSLAEGKHAATGIAFPDLSGPYYSEVILGYESAATVAGQSVLILATHGRADVGRVVLDLAGRVDGLLIMGRTVTDQLVERIAATGVPIVLLARPPVPGCDVVRATNREPAERLPRHLLEHGYRSLVFVGDPDASPDALDRWLGFVDAIERAGLRGMPRVLRCPYRQQAGYDAVAGFLAGGGQADAVVCANDEIALGAYAALGGHSRQVGVDVAVTGWDDIPAARLVSPPLTTVRQPMQQLGAESARLLMARIEGERSQPEHVVLPTETVIRASCGCGLQPERS
jgi:LacI family transcriptional regulator